jgi:hypothetical protein
MYCCAQKGVAGAALALLAESVASVVEGDLHYAVRVLAPPSRILENARKYILYFFLCLGS